MKRLITPLFILVLVFTSCKEEPATTGTLIVNMPGLLFASVGLYDPASVTGSFINTSDAIALSAFEPSGKATFSNVLPGNYIVVLGENTQIRKGVQIIAGQTVSISL